MVAIQLPTLRFELLADDQIARVILLPAAGNGFRQITHRQRGGLNVIVELLHFHRPGDLSFHDIPYHWA
jgi:hypothetical protein